MTLQAALDAVPHDGRWLPLALHAGIVYLAVIVLAGCLVLNVAAQRWQEDLQRRLSVQLPGSTAAVEREAAVAVALTQLRADPDIATADSVPEARLAQLLQRALGPASTSANVLLPAVIEVVVTPAAGDRVADVAARLREVLPGSAVAGIDPESDPGLRLVRTMLAAGWLALTVLAATLAAAVVFATRLRLSVQRPSLEVLLQLGAEDRAVLQIETRAALRTALLAAGLGLLAAGATLISLAAIIVNTPLASLLAPSPLLLYAGLLLLPPLAAVLLATLAARLTVRRVVAAYPW